MIAGPLHRRPAHLNDAHAAVYAPPRYESADSDVILGPSLTPIGGPVDLEGGWVDAGDFVKFTHTTAYADALLLRRAARRSAARRRATLEPEARFGLRWLRKAWDPAHAACSRCRSASARATRPARSTATTTCGGCRSATTR